MPSSPPHAESPNPHAAPSHGAISAPRRRSLGRRLFIGMAALLLLLVGLLLALPTLAGNPRVRAFVVGKVNDEIAGSVSLEDLSFSWFGASRIRGLKIADPEKREVFSIAEAEWTVGLFDYIRNPLAFGVIRLVGPRIDLRVGPDNEISLLRSIQPRERRAASTSEEPMRLPQPVAHIEIKDGFIRLQREGSPAVEIKDLDTDLKIDTLNRIAGQIDAQLADGGRVTGELSIDGAVPDGVLKPLAAAARIRLNTGESLALKPWATIFAPQSGVEGAAQVAIDATYADHKLSGDFNVEVAGLRAGGRGEPGSLNPMNVKLTGKAAMVQDHVNIETKLASDAANANATIEYVPSDRAPSLDGQKLVSAVLTGESLGLPDFSILADAQFDLTKLAQAIPALLAGAGNRQVGAGRVELSQLKILGGKAPSATGGFTIKEVAVREAGKDIRVEPITGEFDLLLEEGRGLKIKGLDLKSSFASVRASGEAAAIQAQIQGNLARLKQELGQFIDLGAVELAGDVNGDVQLARAGDDRVNVTMKVHGKQLVVNSKEGRVELPQAEIEQTGFVTLRERQAVRITADMGRVDLGGKLTAGGSGWYDLTSAAFAADVNAPNADLSFLAQQAAAFGVTALQGLAGSIAAQMKVERAAAEGPVQSTGQLTARGATRDGKKLIDSDATLTWKDARFQPSDGVIRVAAAGLESAIAKLAAKDIEVATRGAVTATGQVDGSADLGPLMQAVAAINGNSPPAVSGRLVCSARGQASGGTVSLAGSGTVEQFKVGEGADSFSDPKLQLEWDASLDPAKSTARLTRLKVGSTPLTAELNGTIDLWGSDCVLGLKGKYQARWDDLMRMVHAMAPATANVVLIKGETASEFEITGPLRAPQVTPAFRGIRSGASMTWASAAIEGVDMGPARLAVSLEDGKLVMPPAYIPASEGRVNVAGSVDFTGSEPVLRVPSAVSLLEKVVLTRQLAEALLSRINPIFLFMVKMEGRASMLVREEVALPLGQSLKTGGAGAARLELTGVRMQPGGILAELIQLGGPVKEEMTTVKVSGVDFTIKEGRLRYDNFTLSFPEGLDLIFRGSVGFDDTLDLFVSLPVRPQLLERLGIKGPTLEYAKLLSKVRVEVPIVGTRNNPKLDFAKVDVRGLMEGVLKQSPEQAVEQLLGGIQKDVLGPKPSSKPPPDKKPATSGKRGGGERPKRKR